MPAFLDVPHQAIPYFEPVKGNNGRKKSLRKGI